MEAIKAMAGILLIGIPILIFAKAYAVFCVTGQWPHQSKRAMELFRDMP